jgi:hypothetical protein
MSAWLGRIAWIGLGGAVGSVSPTAAVLIGVLGGFTASHWFLRDTVELAAIRQYDRAVWYGPYGPATLEDVDALWYRGGEQPHAADGPTA